MKSRHFILCVAVACLARPADKLELTIDTVARGPELVGYSPQDVRWSGDGKRIFFRWKQASDPRDKDFDTYVVGRDGSGLRKLTEDEAKQAPPALADWTQDRKLAVYVRDGDLFVYDYSTDTARRITKTSDVESNPHFLRDGQRIWFTRSGNLYVLSLASGLIEQMTEIRTPGAPAAAPAPAAGFGFGRRGGGTTTAASSTEQQRGTESQEFLKKQEQELLEVIRERARKREEDEARRKRENPRKPFQLQARQSVANLQLAPDEKSVIASVNEGADGAKNAVVPSFVTESAYTETIASRGMVGDTPSRSRLAILSVETGEVKWVDHGQKDRDVTLSPPVWSEDGRKAVLLARAADNKDRWILALDAATGKTRTLVNIHDDAWVDGPGSFTLGWMKNDEDVYFQSERDGYSHLYTASYSGGEPRQLTSGKWEVQSAQLSKDKSRFYLITSEAHSGERQLYTMKAEGGERVRITSMPGQYETPAYSPDDKHVALVYSYVTKPPELYVQELRPGAEARKLTSSPAPEFWTYPWLDAPVVSVPARDGALAPGRLYKPANARRGGPAVIFVHGAGYAQNVHRGWSRYPREAMFHQFLVNHGYIALDLDYRGSAGYGREWRTAIYRHMGGKDLDDQVDAARWLVKEHGVDPKRIGIYGGSYGGFITLMAMFTQPDVFAAGAALRPVTDWTHYNHPYTSNILNLPQKDAEAYKVSSPIYFASGLKGALLICHGMVDTNVHFQDTVRLVQRLIELKKENWEVAIYPVEDHSFVQPSSWADEYKRIFRLFEKNLK